MFASFFFFHDPATTEIYTLSLHDALPISCRPSRLSCSITQFAHAACQSVFPPTGPGSAGKPTDRKSTRLNSSHVRISYAVFCLKKKRKQSISTQRLSPPNSMYLHMRHTIT